MGVAYNTSIVRDGLVLHLDAANPKSYPGTGTTWFDLKGNSNANILNGAIYNSSSNGYFDFDGTNDHALGSISSSIFSGAHTISAWINRTTMKQWSAIFSNNVNAISCSILTFINQTSKIGTNQAGANAADISIDLGSDYLNKWIYVTIVYNGVVNGSAVNVYGFKDGNLISSTGNLYWNLNTSSQYYIGRHYTAATQVHDGFISLVSVYNKALSLEEIKQNFEATRGRYGI